MTLPSSWFYVLETARRKEALHNRTFYKISKNTPQFTEEAEKVTENIKRVLNIWLSYDFVEHILNGRTHVPFCGCRVVLNVVL